MKQELSILIPCYNDGCRKLVGQLVRQATEINGLAFEVIVGDDASTDEAVLADNALIEQWPNCRYLRMKTNRGRAAMRNLLAREARYDWLLFLDCGLSITDRLFLRSYLEEDESHLVVNGGLSIGGDGETMKGNLRYLYEKVNEHRHTAEERRKSPWRSFRTANFMAAKQVLESFPFNEEIRQYGYEDVLFGKRLCKEGIKVWHIDNTAEFCGFESNDDYLRKTDEAMHTLYLFANELRGYSPLLSFVDGIHIGAVKQLMGLSLKAIKPIVRKQLSGSHPNVRLFNLYRLGVFLAQRG